MTFLETVVGSLCVIIMWSAAFTVTTEILKLAMFWILRCKYQKTDAKKYLSMCRIKALRAVENDKDDFSFTVGFTIDVILFILWPLWIVPIFVYLAWFCFNTPLRDVEQVLDGFFEGE